MTRRVLSGLFLAFLFSGCGFLKPPSAQVPSSVWEGVKRQIHRGEPVPLKVGTAKVEMTPPVGTPLAGYGNRRGKPSVGIRDPLYVRAVSLSDGEDTVLLFSSDLLVFPQPVADRILNRISVELKIPRQAVVLATTHTHSGSGGIGHGFLFEQVFGAYDPKIVEGIAGRVVWAGRQAIDSAGPVRWAAARDPAFLNSLVENRAIPGGPIDPALGVFFFESGEKGLRAVLVNAAAHPTLMDSKDFRFSADFPGEICRRIEETYPGSICLFFNGAAGDARPQDRMGDDPDQRIERFGRAVAEGITGLINRAETRATGDLAAWGTFFPLPPPQLRIGPIPIHPSIGRLMRPTSVFVNLIALDQVLWVPLSAELTAEVGLTLKQRLALAEAPPRASAQRLTALAVQPVLLDYANGYIGYAVTAQRYNSGSYEAWMTWYGPGLGDALIDQICRLADLYKEVRS